MSIAEWARYYVQCGLRPIRIKPGTKFPVDEGWKDHAMPDEYGLAEQVWYGYNLGLAMGNGVLALDIDCKTQNQVVASGYDTLARLEAQYGPLPQTRRHRTPSGGAHLFFKVPFNLKASNTRKRFGHAIWAGTSIEQTGIDIRSYGGQVVAPPSTISTGIYEVIDDSPPAMAPEWLLQIIPRKFETTERGIEHAYTGELDATANIAVVTRAYENAPSAFEGERNNRAFELACIGRERGLSAEKAAQLLHIVWNSRNQPPIEWPELYTTTVNAYRYAQNKAGAKDPGTEFSARSDMARGFIDADLRGFKYAHDDTVYQNGYALNLRWAEHIAAQPITWLWHEKIAQGKLNILAGDPGQGKSTVAIDLAAHISKGEQWADGTPCEQGTVLIFNCEDAAEDTIKPRLIAAGANMHNVAIVSGVPKERNPGETQTEVMFNLAHHLQHLQQTLYTLHQQGRTVKLMIIDPISAYLADKDSYKDSEIRGLLTPVQRLAEDYNVGIICVHHLRKTRGGGSLNRLAGTIGFGAAARMVWMSIPDADDPNNDRYFLLPSKASVTKGKSGLAYTIETAWVHEANSADLINTSRIKWLSEKIDKHADEALADADDKRDGRRKTGKRMRDIQDWLRDTLQSGPEDAATIMADGIDKGFSRKSINDAAKIMKLKREHGQWALLDEFTSVRPQ